jgi:hypothetical protein
VPLIDNTDKITQLIPNEPRRRTKFYTSIPHGFIRLLSAGILANRNSKTLERITADESWAYKDDESRGLSKSMTGKVHLTGNGKCFYQHQGKRQAANLTSYGLNQHSVLGM